MLRNAGETIRNAEKRVFEMWGLDLLSTAWWPRETRSVEMFLAEETIRGVYIYVVYKYLLVIYYSHVRLSGPVFWFC